MPGQTRTAQSPQSKGEMLLIDGGLGGMKISFDHNGNAEHVKERLEIYFPKLKSSGGFEIFQCRGTRAPLKVITPSRNGYTVIVMFLRACKRG